MLCFSINIEEKNWENSALSVRALNGVCLWKDFKLFPFLIYQYFWRTRQYLVKLALIATIKMS